MNYYDVEFISPVGNYGKHTAVDAESVLEAVQKSPLMLSYGTPWKPEEWTVISVVPSPKENLPRTSEEHEAFLKEHNSIKNRILRILGLK